ncbi:MAG: ABC transporter permease [Geminicoccaceae bacterium]
MTPVARDWRLALRLGLRDLRGSGRSFAVLLGALTLGVAIIAAVGILNQGVQNALERDARALLGGDLELEQANVPIAATDLARIAPAGAARSEQISLSTLASSGAGRSVSVSLKAVDTAYPLVGDVLLDPPMPLADALRGGGAVAERTLLARLDVGLGGEVRIGETTVRITAILLREPDRVGGLFGLGPRMLIHRATLDAAQVLLPGALARYEYKLALPDGTDAAAFAAALQRDWPDAGWRARSPRDVQPEVTRVTDRLATFLTLAGLTALLSGGLGIALTIETHLARRTATIATLKSLGASGSQVFAVYLAQVMLLAVAGVALGLALGLVLPLAVRLVPEGALPISPELGVYAGPLARAALAGLLTTFVFAVWPLAIARETSPARLFRAIVAPTRRWPRRRYLALLGLGIAGLVALAIVGVPQPVIGAWFVVTVVVAAVLLWGLTRLVLMAAGRIAHRGGFALRLAIANLHRPGSPSPRVIVALGAGVTLLCAVAILATNLKNEISLRLPSRAPALYLIDVQPDQRAVVNQVLSAIEGARLDQMLPSLRARVVRIAGKPVGEVKVADNVAWTVSRDRGFTYADSLAEGSELVAGSWWPKDYTGPPLVSIDEEIAKGYGVGLGDTLTFNVLGRNLETRIASIRREIDWSGGRLDFLFIVNPSALAGAPHTFVAAVDVPEAGEVGLLDQLASRLPNVTAISLRELVARATEVLDRVGLAVDIVAGVTLGGGIMALAGGIVAARQRQRYETVILKVLGARRRVLLEAFLVEYLVIGLAVALVGGLLGSLAAWLLVTEVMTLSWSPAPLALLMVLGGSILAVVLVGGASLWRLIDLPVAPALRSA